MSKMDVIGDTCKDRRIDYSLIDKINKQYETKARKAKLKAKLAKKKETQNQEKEKAEQNPANDINYIKTPDELRNITGNYSLHKGIYLIDFEIHVPNGCGLILEPGVEFYFTKTAGITCRGRFEAKGKSGLEVLLTAKDKQDGWNNLYLKGGAEAILDYAGFSYGKGRVDKDGDISGGAVLLESEKGLKPGITINHSCFENNSNVDCGGAIYNYKGDVIIKEDNIFKNNSNVDCGGAIYNYHGNVRIKENNRFEKNSAESKGGAIYNIQGDIRIKENNRFENNSADFGGVIYNEREDIRIDKNNKFENNSANEKGGVIYISMGHVEINENNRFEHNSAGDYSGAIHNYLGKLKIDLSKNIFKNNTPNDISEV